MASNNPSSSEASSEPINFRAALAAFEQNSSSSSSTSPQPPRTSYNSPKVRNAAAAAPQTPHRSSSGPDPVPRSSSTPRIRKISDSLTLLSPASAASNPFSGGNGAVSPRFTSAAAVPVTSASGMLSAPSPTFPASASPHFASPLKKSGSGLSLKELMNKSLPRGSPSPVPSAFASSGMSRSRSKSAAGETSSNVSSGRSTPARTLNGLFAPEDDYDGSMRRTSSPAGSSLTMLDNSADDSDHTHPMFAHAVMQPGRNNSAPPSPGRKLSHDGYLPPPAPPRKGSASSLQSGSAAGSTPRLPPRPSSLAPSPTISEFGALLSSAPRGNVGYATYTPGVKRGGGAGAGAGGEGVPRDGTMTPPALPPRSATLGQAERGRLDAPSYQTRQKSPLKAPAPTIPKKPSKPVPPPRPGAAGGFRFGNSSSTSASADPPPPPRQRTTTGGATHQRTLTNSSNSAGVTGPAHRKTGSNVFTSISLSDDASSELKRSLESDLHADHQHHPHQLRQAPPPTRGRPPSTPSSSSASTTIRSTPGGSGVVSSLIGTAASALPLFKSGGGGGGGALAEGAPSKQQHYGGYSGGVAVSRSASAHSDLSFRPGEMGVDEVWGTGRAVELADAGSSRTGLKEPRDDAAKKRYEKLFETALQRQAQKKKQPAGLSSTLNSKPNEAVSGSQRKVSAGGVQALRGWFESDPSSTATTTSTAAIATPQPTLTTSDASPSTSSSALLLPKTVRQVWTRSRLSPTFLAQTWDRAVALQLSSSSSSEKTSTSGLGRDAFIRGLASIDAELERKQKKRRARAERSAAKKKREAALSAGVGAGAGRRVPPPPPSASAV